MLNKTITIKSIEEGANGKKLVLKDENGDKFNLWKNKVDGNPTKAHDYFLTNNLSFNSQVEIGYKSEQKTYNGHNYEERTILAFKAPSGSAPYQTPQTTQKPAYGANLASSDILRLNDNIQRLVKKIQDQDKEIGAIKTWIAGFPDGEKGLALHRALEDNPKIKALNEEIPIIGIEEEVKIEDINF